MLFVIATYNKYVWVFPLKDEKGIKISNAFQNHMKNQKMWTSIN